MPCNFDGPSFSMRVRVCVYSTLLPLTTNRPPLHAQHAVVVAAPSVWNSLVYYVRDPALGLNRFRHQSKTFLFAHYQAHRIDIIIRHINLLTYLLTTLLANEKKRSGPIVLIQSPHRAEITMTASIKSLRILWLWQQRACRCISEKGLTVNHWVSELVEKKLGRESIQSVLFYYHAYAHKRTSKTDGICCVRRRKCKTWKVHTNAKFSNGNDDIARLCCIFEDFIEAKHRL